MTDLRYPIGKYNSHEYSEKLKTEWLNDIKFLPAELENAIQNLDEQQLNTRYRDEGWTIKQVVHHVADSHINAYTRFKLGYTESKPTIKPYDENAWANLNDIEHVPINVSITILHAVHLRLHSFLSSLAHEDWNKLVIHPEHGKEMSLWHLLGLYAWHGKHHTAHITHLRDRNIW